jgi:hypothetical protein
MWATNKDGNRFHFWGNGDTHAICHSEMAQTRQDIAGYPIQQAEAPARAQQCRICRERLVKRLLAKGDDPTGMVVHRRWAKIRNDHEFVDSLVPIASRKYGASANV